MTLLRFRPPIASLGGLLLLVSLLLGMGVPTAFGEGAHAGSVWPFQDGSLVVEDGEIAFAYLPFLSVRPAWAPALPQYPGQPVEPVRPLPGLGGRLSIGLAEGETGFSPFEIKVLESSPDSGRIELTSAGVTLLLNLQSAMGHKGVHFELEGSGQKLPPLKFVIEGSPQRLLWAKPGKKERHDWGESVWEWDDRTECLVHDYSTPLDATRSMTSGLWFSEGVQPEAVIRTDPKGLEDARIEIAIHPGALEKIRFGFLHADNRASFESSVAEAKGVSLADARSAWEKWTLDSRTAIAQAVIARSSGEFRPSESDARLIDRGLVRIRQLFLSNGMVLDTPLTPGEFPYSLRDQSIALSFWRRMGLDFPYAAEWRDLVQYNPAMERTIPIATLRGDDVRESLRSASIPVIAPDPENPPTKEAFDTLLGYIIDGGRVTLVDGFSGFEGKTGWWTEAGAADPADYAIRVLGVPVDRSTRKRLDEEGLSPLRNVFAAGMTPLEFARTGEGQVRVAAPEGGFLFVSARDEKDPEGVRLLGGRIGDRLFRAMTPSEDNLLSASHQPEIAWSDRGGIVGRTLRGEAFAMYELPRDASSVCEFDLEGEALFHWASELPPTEHLLVKKVIQTWFHRALLTFPVSRAAHPVVYNGTYTCRVFDVTGTEVSPILFHKIGQGSFVWVGLPVDSIRLGSDRGTDAQCSLREDPGYDLIRMTLALHDPKQAGAQQAGVTPRFVWTDRFNVRADSPPQPDLPIHAWESIRQMGPAAGNRTFWGWAFTGFTGALRSPGWDREKLEGSALSSVPKGDGAVIDLYGHASYHALYRDIEGAAGNLNRDWQNNAAKTQADRIERELIECLHLNSPTPWAARWVVDGTFAEEAPLEDVYDETLLAVALFEGARFPGGGEARGKILDRLLSSPPDSPSDETSALLSVLDEANRGSHLERLFPLSPSGSVLPENPKTLAPALMGRILEASTPNRG